MTKNQSVVFDRRKSADTEINASFYNFIIGLTILWGVIVNIIMVKYISVDSIQSIPNIIFIVGYFASCILGVYLFENSESPIISFIGYNFVVVPFGMIINLVVSRYNPELIIKAVSITGLVTFTMMILGAAFPKIFKSIIGPITYSLLLVILYEWIGYMFFDIEQNIIDWIVVFLFCGYIGYDWGRANQIPKTVDNAIDSAAALYMDIINLFLRVLKILGRK